MSDQKGRIKPRDALILLFKARARIAAKRGSKTSIYSAIAENLSMNGGSASASEPAKDGDPYLR